MIRPANVNDIPCIIALGQQLHAESSYSHLPYNVEKVAALMEQLIQGAGVVFVAEKDGEVVGGIAGAITEHWFCDVRLAFDYSFFIAPEQRHGITALRLLRAFTEWSKIRGASEIRMGITTAINVGGTSRLYRAAGFSDAGVLFCKGLEHGR
ncbi:N-acetyltransferase family protein [Mixta calida]|uniref:N-acetyltransferase family protein n=1 Tax=Mixta calida TaxID=665913 RepID=UPI0034D443B2